ncbi:MAG: hypothetical protein BMS9Abin37_0701 [Acidobacteriota bacterium]|nr:MAG: hypothetical protein BMS9Abin37_0701 [Acidobacteriota bacterium]
MIQNEKELEVTRGRIEQFQRWLSQIREKAGSDDFDSMASGYRLEIERMQAEVMDYLLRPAQTEGRGTERSIG